MDIQTQFAIVFHELNNSDFFATKHRFCNGGLASGTPIDVEATIEKLRSLLPKQKTKNINLIPSNVFLQQDNILGWVTPPQMVTLTFKGAIVTTYEVPMPRLIFIAKGGVSPGVKICAIKSDAPISLDTPIYYAPLPNVYDSHGMCVGDVSLPKIPLYSNMAEYEKGLFGSYSTHTNHNNVVKIENCTSANYVKFISNLQKEKATKFDDCYLVDAKQTVQNLLKGL